MKKTALVINTKTGEFEERVQDETSTDAPRRSWKRGGEKNAYDMSFVDSDGATVLAVYPQNFPLLKAQRDEVLAMARGLAEKGQAFDELQNNPENALSTEQMNELEEKLRAQTRAVTTRQNTMSLEVVTACVIGWKNAPIPYSEQNRDELPFDICVEWTRKILEQTELSQGEADFLQPASPIGSPVAG